MINVFCTNFRCIREGLKKDLETEDSDWNGGGFRGEEGEEEVFREIFRRRTPEVARDGIAVVKVA